MRQRFLAVCSTLLVLMLLALTPGMAAPVAAGERACFNETGFCAENAFLSFWKGHGALEILGFPISQPFVDNRGLIVQFYERAIMEWHPENPPQYQVLLTLLGAGQLGNRPERTAPPTACPAGDASCAIFAETGHTLRGTFLAYWQANGGLPVFGFPLTEEFTELSPTNGRPYTVQYFERNRFEYHPEVANPRFQVLLGLLGFELLQGQRQVLDRPVAQVPDYVIPAAGVGRPVQLAIPAINITAPIEPVGVDQFGNMVAPKTPTGTTWYEPGARPGQQGNAAISGHVDFAGYGEAVFWNVRTLRIGTEIFVTDENGARRRFIVQAVETYLEADAPRERIFGPSTDVNLNLITCTGDFDPISHSYDKRTVVYARWDGATP